MKDLILQEQVLDTLPTGLAIHVRDKKPHVAKEIGEIASTYEQSRAIFRNASGNQGNDGERKHRRRDSEGKKKEDNSRKNV